MKNKNGDAKEAFLPNGLNIANRSRNDNLDELLAKLQMLGFGEHEARAYIALFQSGPVTAYELAKVAGIPKANAYSVAESLSNKGALQIVSDKPKRYIARDRKELFSTIEANTSQLCHDVFEKLSQIDTEQKLDYVVLLQGRDLVVAQLNDLIKNAESHIRLKASKKQVEFLRAQLKGASKRKISVSIVSYSKDPDKLSLGGGIKVLPHEGHGLAYGVGESYLTITVDSQKAMIIDIESDYDAAFSENHLFVYMVDVLLKHEMVLSEIMLSMGDQIENKWGVGFKKLRDAYP